MDGYWILLGMMGAGKSTVGKALSALSVRPFVDTDSLLERRFGRPIATIFEVYGEDAFRGHETSILKSLEPEPSILATGGGIITRPENWDEFRRLGTTIFLDVPPAALKERLIQSRRRRPLLEVEAWEDRFDALYAQRIETYRQADVIVPIVEGTTESCAERILELMEAYS